MMKTNKLLTINGIFSNQDSSHLREDFDQYLMQLGNDNPFFPLLDGLKGSVNQERVFKSFEHAHSFYTKVSASSGQSEPARLYKLGELGTNKFFNKEFKKQERYFLSLSTPSEKIIATINEIHLSENEIEKEVGCAFFKKIDEITEALKQQASQVRKNQLKPIFKTILDDVSKHKTNVLLKTDKSKIELEILGAVYTPEGYHSWGANLVWELAHIRRGHEFIVCAEIFSHQYRRGFGCHRILIVPNGISMPKLESTDLILQWQEKSLIAHWIDQKTDDPFMKILSENEVHQIQSIEGLNSDYTESSEKKDIDLINMVTKSCSYPFRHVQSAFAKEFCVALKSGYSLCKIGDEIKLQPLGLKPEHLSTCDSTGAPGDGINPSDEEIEWAYQQLRAANWEGSFQCSFDFQKREIGMEILLFSETPIVEEQGALIASTSSANIQPLSTLSEQMHLLAQQTQALQNQFSQTQTQVITFSQNQDPSVVSKTIVAPNIEVEAKKKDAPSFKS